MQVWVPLEAGKWPSGLSLHVQHASTLPSVSLLSIAPEVKVMYALNSDSVLALLGAESLQCDGFKLFFCAKTDGEYRMEVDSDFNAHSYVTACGKNVYAGRFVFVTRHSCSPVQYHTNIISIQFINVFTGHAITFKVTPQGCFSVWWGAQEYGKVQTVDNSMVGKNSQQEDTTLTVSAKETKIQSHQGYLRLHKEGYGDRHSHSELVKVADIKNSEHSVSGPSQSQSQLLRVACIGDSLTWGYGASSQQHNYPSVLASLLGKDKAFVYNFGEDGATGQHFVPSSSLTPYSRTEFYHASLSFGPDVVIIMLGLNDAKNAEWSDAVYQKDMQELVGIYQVLKLCLFVVIVVVICTYFDMQGLSSQPHVYLVIPPCVVPTEQVEKEGIDPHVLRFHIPKILKTVSMRTNSSLIGRKNTNFTIISFHCHNCCLILIGAAIHTMYCLCVCLFVCLMHSVVL